MTGSTASAPCPWPSGANVCAPWPRPSGMIQTLLQDTRYAVRLLSRSPGLRGHRHSHAGSGDRGERGHFQRGGGRPDCAAAVSRAGSPRAACSRNPRRIRIFRWRRPTFAITAPSCGRSRGWRRTPRRSSAGRRRRSRTAARHAGHFGVLRAPGISTGDGPRVRAAGRGGRATTTWIILSHALWMRRFNGDAGIVGRRGASVGPHVPGRRRSSRRFPARRRDIQDVWSRGSRGRVVGPDGATGREPGQSLLSFLQRRGPGPHGCEPVGDGRGSAPDGEARRDALPDAEQPVDGARRAPQGRNRRHGGIHARRIGGRRDARARPCVRECRRPAARPGRGAVEGNRRPRARWARRACA